MSNLFTELAAEMEDRQEVILNIKKIGEDLVIMVTPDLKKKGTVIQLTGNPSEMDLNFMHEFKKPVVNKTEFSSEVVSTEEEDKPNKNKNKGTSSKKKVVNRRASQAKKSAPKKQAANKAPVKKAPVKKAVVKKAAPKKGLSDLLNKKPEPKPEVKKVEPVIDEKKIAEQAVADKLKADKEAFAQLIIDGGKHYDAHEWPEAEAAYVKATQLFPSDVKANIALANTRKWIRAIEKSLTD